MRTLWWPLLGFWESWAPLELKGYWTEHSERSVLPTALSQKWRFLRMIRTC